MILYEKTFNLKLSGDQVYHAACSLLVILKNSCGKFHCQKGFNLIHLSYRMQMESTCAYSRVALADREVVESVCALCAQEVVHRLRSA